MFDFEDAASTSHLFLSFSFFLQSKKKITPRGCTTTLALEGIVTRPSILIPTPDKAKNIKNKCQDPPGWSQRRRKQRSAPSCNKVVGVSVKNNGGVVSGQRIKLPLRAGRNYHKEEAQANRACVFQRDPVNLVRHQEIRRHRPTSS